MAMAVVQQHKESSSSSGSMGGGGRKQAAAADAGKYVRYTSEQVEALERVYAECPKPSSLRRQQLIRECHILSNIEAKQIKVWFQNRRCREKLRKESTGLQSLNRKLSAMNKLLTEENDRLQKQVSQLVCENGFMRQQLRTTSAPNKDGSCESSVSTPQPPTPHPPILRDCTNPSGLISVAEETLTEFLSKATGTAIDWVQMPGMKPGPDSVGIFAVSHSCSGVAARACGLVSLEPAKVAEILKDRPSWLRDCRSLEVFTMFPTGNGGTIELVYTQMFAPTTLAPPRDLWTLRYTTSLKNGNIVVCERSLSGSGAGPSGNSAPPFVRAEMFPSGYLIRPCDGGGSIIHIVDHFNFEVWSIPEVLRPMYQSSSIIAQKMTISALRYVRQIAQESSGEVVYGCGRQPAVLRALSRRLSRGFNNAVNGFTDDGWSSLNCDGTEDIMVAVNSLRGSNSGSSSPAPLCVLGGILCAKASMLIQNVPPAILVRFLREHRSEWADFSVDAYSATSLKAGSYSTYQGVRPTRFTGGQLIMPLGHTVENQEVLEVIRLEGLSFPHDDSFMSRDIHLLQMCSGIEEGAIGAFSELIFAPIDEMFPDDAPLLPSGFRIIPLGAKSGEMGDDRSGGRTLDLTSSLEVGMSNNSGVGEEAVRVRCTGGEGSVLTIAFQFPFESGLQEKVGSMARHYIRSVISSVQRVAMAISPSRSDPSSAPLIPASPTSPPTLTLAIWICHSYSFHFGVDLLSPGCGGESLLRELWNHHDAVLCCSLKCWPVFMFANQAGLDMLETTLVSLQDITMEDIFDGQGRSTLCSDFPKIMHQGHGSLPAGVCVSSAGRSVGYEQVVLWKVFSGGDTVHCFAFSFINWSFL